jgi:hypothetical protein
VIFPTRNDYDQKSQKVGRMSDLILFFRNDSDTSSSLSGTYYIGVYGYSYASYSILTTIKRTKSSSNDILREFSVMLYEAIPQKKSLHNEFEFFYSYFDVEIADEDNFSIQISLSNI